MVCRPNQVQVSVDEASVPAEALGTLLILFA
jgi:hypothetical protein